MKKFIMNYPGDPPVEVFELDRKEFFKIFPPENRGIKSSVLDRDGKLIDSSFEPMGDTILCDLCSSNLNGDGPFYLIGGTRLYCPGCYSINSRYCTEVPTKLKIERKCVQCKGSVSFEVFKNDWEEYSKPKSERKHIQDIFAYLDPDQREILTSGICGGCFDKMFSEDSL